MNIERRGRGTIVLGSASFGVVLVCVLMACASSTSTPAPGIGTDPPDATAADASTEDAEPAVDASKPGDFGQPCPVGDDTACSEGLFCLEGPSGGTNGFCTKTCSKTSSAACPDAPAGTAAYCVVTDVNGKGDKGCAFVCRQGSATYDCPGKLKCQTTEEPAGSGQRLCLP